MCFHSRWKYGLTLATRTKIIIDKTSREKAFPSLDTPAASTFSSHSNLQRTCNDNYFNMALAAEQYLSQ
jgi:hypothetical protein